MLQRINEYTDFSTDINEEIMVSVVIPAHNEQERIGVAVDSVLRAFSKNSMRVEVIVVDDGSTDATQQEALRMAHQYPEQVRVTSVSSNHGKGFALRTGFAQSKGDLVGFIDADLEYPVDALPIMASIMREETRACAIGSRVVDDRTRWERMTSQVAHKLAAVALQLPVQDTQAGMKMFPGSFARSTLISGRQDGWLYDIEALLHAVDSRLTIVEIPVMQKSVRQRRASVWAMIGCGPSIAQMAWSRWQSRRRNPGSEARQVGRFGLVGIINSVADLAAYWAMIRLWSPDHSGLQAGFESMLAWLFASLVGYTLHSRFTFRRKLSRSGFYVVTGLGVAIQVVTTGLVTQWTGGTGAMWGKFLGIGLASLVTYFGYRHLARHSGAGATDDRQPFVHRANIPTVIPQEP